MNKELEKILAKAKIDTAKIVDRMNKERELIYYIYDDEINDSDNTYGIKEVEDSLGSFVSYQIKEWVILPIGGFWIHLETRWFPDDAEKRVKWLNKHDV